MQSRDGWSERGRTQQQPNEPDSAPLGALVTAGSDSGTGGGVNDGSRTTVTVFVGVAYHQSYASFLDAAVA